jgi:hypothetical protein
MSHPFEAISLKRLHTAFWLFAAITAILLTVQGAVYLKLTNPVASLGILSLELAATPDRLNQVVSSWAEGAKSGMIFSLGLNFLCLFALTNTLAVACVMEGRRLTGTFSRLGPPMAWAQWLAAVIWAVQNSLLAWGVLGQPSQFTTVVSAWLAMAKFAIFGAGLLYTITAALLALARPRSLTARQ